MQHLDIGNRPVRCSEIRLERTGRHVNQDQFDEEQQERVLDELKDKIKPPPDAKIPAEQFTPKLPGHFREGPHRTDKRAERFLCQKRHDQESEKKHQRRRMNRVKMSGEQPGLETHQRTDRQKTFDTRRARIISGHSLRLEMTHEQPELDTEEHAPAEEEPLDQLSPVVWLFTTEDVYHRCRGYTYLQGMEMTLIKKLVLGAALANWACLAGKNPSQPHAPQIDRILLLPDAQNHVKPGTPATGNLSEICFSFNRPESRVLFDTAQGLQ